MAALPDPAGSKPPKTLAEAELPARARRALDDLMQAARDELSRQLQDTLQDIETALSRTSPIARDQKLEAAQFTSLRSLEQGGPAFIARFLAEVEQAIAGMRSARNNRRLAELHAAPAELSLVDDDAMTDQAVLNNIASRIESRNSLALQLLGHRFGVLAAAPAFDAEHLPLGPFALCQALYAASNVFDFTPAARLQLFRDFERAMMAGYGPLLETLNNRLAEAGILPHLSFVPVRARPAGTESPRATGSRPALDASMIGDAGTSLGAGPMARANFGQNAPDEPRIVARRQSPQSAAQPAPQASREQAAAPRREPLPSGFVALQNLLRRRRVLLAKLRPGGQDDRVREPLQRDEVMAALQRMRANGTKANDLGGFRQILLAQARQLHGHGVTLSDPDSDTFELLSLFLAQLQRDLRKGSQGEALLERLRLPMLQLALRDHRFFVDAGHPARMLLSAVSLAGARWLAEDDLDPQWLGLLQRAVATVQQDAEGAFDTFVDANQTLQSGLQALARKAEMAERRQVEAARGREKLEIARQRAGAEIAHLLEGRSLPRFQSILMDQAWADVLALTHLRHGEQSDAWRDALDATARIINASSGSGPQIAYAGFISRLQAALEQVGYHAEDAAAIARQLANGRNEDADLASRTELLVQLRARARLGEGNAAGATVAQRPPRSDDEQAAYERLRGLQEPVWMEIEDEDDLPLRRRLAWVSPRTGQVLVVNRRGMRGSGDDLDALARKLAAGRLRLLEHDATPADAAWEATMSSLQRIGDDGARDGEAGHGR